MPGKRKSSREKNLTSRYFAGKMDDDRIEQHQRFTQRSKHHQRDKTAKTTLLRAMLGGHATYNEDTFGALLLPTGHETLKGSATFSGVALSPFGIREVNLLFENGRVRLPATLKPDPIATTLIVSPAANHWRGLRCACRTLWPSARPPGLCNTISICTLSPFMAEPVMGGGMKMSLPRLSIFCAGMTNLWCVNSRI